jgi:demethylmenaquinone methyltransferase/2-methoxy-6-polyprenyl-1,4-benzoquinol methylase
MAHLRGAARRNYVQAVFARIAGRYDRLNRLMTAGRDAAWRRAVIGLASLQPGQRVLDLGAGTGDLAQEAIRRCPQAQVVAADFTLAMMQQGRRRPGGAAIPWLAADALSLPFPAASFDVVLSGFLIRNVVDVAQALREQWRVLTPGGQIVLLDTTRPPRNWLSPLIRLHLQVGIPLLGRLIAQQPEAYTYLSESTAGFLSAEQLAVRLQAAGFKEVQFQRRMLGMVAIHWAVK